MSTRNIDFSDGFQSSASPTAGATAATGVGAYADDSAFATAKGAAAAVGDIYFNTTTGFFRVHNGTQFDDYVNDNDTQTVAGDKTFSGTTTFVNDLEVTDNTITVNDGGSDATAEGAGILVERTGTSGAMSYEDALASKWKIGALGAEIEVMDVSSTQTGTNKTFDANSNTFSNFEHGAEVDNPSSGVHGVTGSVVGTTDTQILTNKDYDGGTASNTSRLTIPQDTKTNLDGLTRKEGTLVYANDLDSLWYDDGSTLNEVGTGAGVGGINYITNSDAEVNTAGWVDYNDLSTTEPVDGTGGTATANLVRSASTDLRGSALFSLTSGANTQGEGFSYDFSIDSADLSKPLTISFDYTADANFQYNGGVPGNESSIMIFIYDVTNATLIRPLISGLDGSGRFVSSFQADAVSTSYRLIFHIAIDTPSWIFRFDNVQVGPSATAVTPAVTTDWESASVTSSWDANGTTTSFKRRVGDSYQYDINLALGSAPSGTLTFSLPSGDVIDLAKLSSNATSAVHLGDGVLFDAGTRQYDCSVTLNSSTVVNVIHADETASSNTVSATAPFPWTNTDTVNINFTVPIVGLSSGRTSAVAVDSNRPVFAEIYDTGAPGGTIGGTFGASTLAVFDSTAHDTHGAYNASTGEYTIPVTGRYAISGQVNVGGTESNNDFVDVYLDIDGVQYATQQSRGRVQNASLSSYLHNFEFKTEFQAGQVVGIRVASNIGSPAFSATAGQQFMNISKLDTGSPLAALTEDVYCHAYLSSAQTFSSSGGGQQVDIDASETDSHNAFDTVNNKYVIPQTARYRISANVTYNASGAGSRGVFIYINGSERARGLVTGTATQSTSVNTSRMLDLIAGDEVTLLGLQDSGGNLGLATSAHTTFLSIEKI